MRELLFNISGQKLEKNENCNFDDIVMNSNNYLKLLFDFDASWKGSRKAIKLTNGKDKEVNLLIKGNSTQKTTTGKNLLEPYGSFPKTSSNITFDLKEDGFHINGKCLGNNSYIPIYSNTLQPGTYYVNGITGGSNSSYQLVVFKNDTIMSYVTYNNFKITLSESATIELKLYVYSSYGTFNDLVLPYMICKNESELTTYEPYTGGQPSPSPEYPQEVTGVDKILATFKGNKSTLTKSLNHTLLKPLYRLSKNVYDYIDFNKGKIIRNIGVITFDGSSDEQWQFASNRAKIDISNMKSLIYNDGHVYFCDKFKYNKNVYSDTSTEDGFITSGVALYIRKYDEFSKMSKNADVNKYFQSNPITVVYQLATPTEEDIPSALLTQLQALQTYYPVTFINFTSTVKPFVDLEYIVDMKYSIDSLYNTINRSLGINSIDNDVVGVQINYSDGTNTRLAGAIGLTPGVSFDKFKMFGGRKRCNVADDGTILAYYGDDDYKEDFSSNNYEPAGFTLTNNNGYISAIGYNPNFDWLFFASESKGDSSTPVGDYTFQFQDFNDYHLALLSGGWHDESLAGGFGWRCYDSIDSHYRDFSGRLVYIPNLKNW